MTVALLPVHRKTGQDQLQNAAGQIGIVDFGQNDEARIVGDEGATTTALLGRPADELVARFEMPSRRAPTGQSQPLAAIGDHITELLPDQMVIVQVMVLDDEGFIASPFLGKDGPDSEAIQNVLFVGLRTAEFGF